MSALLTPAQAAAYLGDGYPEARVRRLAQERKIAHRRDGRFLRFTLADLDAYVEAIAQPAVGVGMVRTRPRRRS